MISTPFSLSSALSWNPLEPTQFALGCEDDNRPVIQLWDVRQAQQPYQIIEGHQKGITNVEWSRADPRLLMSSGRDGSVLIFDVKRGVLDFVKINNDFL